MMFSNDWGTAHIKRTERFSPQFKRICMINDLMIVRAAIDGTLTGGADSTELVAALEVLDALISAVPGDVTAADAAPVENNDESA